jgi:hypothetical protein
MEFYLLLGFFLLGCAGCILSLTSLSQDEGTGQVPESLWTEREGYLSKWEDIGINQWNTYEINGFELSEQTEITIAPQIPIKIYGNQMIGFYFKERRDYEITIRNKHDRRVYFREFISL